MSRGGVYHHYSSTNEMLKDLMLDGNEYRSNLINEYLANNKCKDKEEQMAEILASKALAETDLMKLYAHLLQAKSYNKTYKAFEDDVVKKIVRTQIAYDTYGYDIITLSGLILEIKEDQPGLQIITQEEVNENN